MYDSILDKIKEQKLRELQSQFDMNSQENEEQKLKAQIGQLENLIKRYLSREALLRYGNIKTVNPENATQILAVLSQLIQYKKQDEKISDEELKLILRKIDEQKRETKIQFTK